MADTELTNHKTEVDVVWGVGDGSDKGTAYAEEYLYHNKLVSDFKVVYIKDDTAIALSLKGSYFPPLPSVVVRIRYKLDRDRQVYWRWSDTWNLSATARLLPEYTAPFTLASQQYESGQPVVGGVGHNGGAATSKTARYFKGLEDEFGDEWHTLGYAVDVREGWTGSDQAWWSEGGKEVWLVVNPKTPCLTVRAGTGGEFVTTDPKAYWTPRIVAQTTRFSGACTFEIRDINGGNVFYRIGGSGGFTAAGASSVTLDQDDFASGSQLLEYYLDADYVKSRTVVKNPTHPSLAETHGQWLGLTAGSASLATIQNRLGREPYRAAYLAMRDQSNASGTGFWDTNGYQGRRLPIQEGGGGSLACAFVALIEGPSFARSAGGKTLLRYALEMVEDQHRTQDAIGFEWSHKTDPIPSIISANYIGYYDARTVQLPLFAYDIIAANFRSDQVPGGMTPIQDYFIRETFAAFAYETMMWAGNMTGREPGMWGGSRWMTAQEIAMVMPEYSCPVYGTSGFGTPQTTYPFCPFEDDQYTWKEALWDRDNAVSTFPNLTHQPSPGEGFSPPPFTSGGVTYNEGVWGDKASYLSNGLTGSHFQIWANLAARFFNRYDSGLTSGFHWSTTGSGIWGLKAPIQQRRLAQVMLLNSYFPDIAQNNFDWVKTAPGDENVVPAVRGAGVFGLAWYDDQWEGTAPVTEAPTFTAQPTSRSVTVGDNATFSALAIGIPAPAYQWRKDGANISGATGASLAITDAELADAGSYSCVATNSAGSATSSTASLAVNALPPPAAVSSHRTTYRTPAAVLFP